MPRYNEFESHLVQLFNASKNLSWSNKTYSEIFACKPATQGSGGEYAKSWEFEMINRLKNRLINYFVI